MNWFTRVSVASASVERKQELIDADGGCEHATKDLNLAQVLRSEKDSFGTVGTYVCCQACDDEIDKREDEEEVVCYDCSGAFQKKDTVSWKWYDFYAPQGDEPLTICKACRIAPKHIERVRKDRQDYESEMNHYDEQDAHDSHF